MPQTPLYPLKLEPTLHVRVWGGRQLAERLGKRLPTDEPYGESWEVHDTSTIANGALAGQTLGEALAHYGSALLGAGVPTHQGFPLLIKFLNSEDWLSVQVHPNDDQARTLEGDPRGKTEAWIVLHAEEGAQIVVGLQAGSTPESMAQAIRDNALEPLLAYANVQAGDALLLEANTVHALGKGLLVYEVQQSSDVTYRLYDWGRMGTDGKPRQLHVEKGVSVANLRQVPTITHPLGDGVVMAESAYFRTVRHELRDHTLTLETNGRCHAITCIEGSITLTHDETTVRLAKGETALVPAALGAVVLVGNGDALRSYLL
jgi:mannose-6-phosphate isomerase